MTRANGVVYVVAKAPRRGVTKTRLCPPLTPDQAAQLARAFLLDTLTTITLARLNLRIVCRGTLEQQTLRRLVGPRVPVSIQSNQGLGDALEGAFREGLADGFDAVAVLGGDSPTLPPLVLSEAFAALTDCNDVVLGPADDGGYYLLAARAVHPALFREMTWSTGGVAGETLRRCRTLGLRTHVLPPWYDVDDAASLAGLRTDLRRLPLSTAPQTRAVLEALDDGTLPLGDAA
ncbi:MAG: TIGR04282 family arsenosugar biosynthesis glycosyltransferase [Chloroflexi bacterium]|nr:TIGR04282 family arsenosugar biosynthesis glycosyltransferase [Chloroflexota bacterium]